MIVYAVVGQVKYKGQALPQRIFYDKIRAYAYKEKMNKKREGKVRNIYRVYDYEVYEYRLWE